MGLTAREAGYLRKEESAKAQDKAQGKGKKAKAEEQTQAEGTPAEVSAS